MKRTSLLIGATAAALLAAGGAASAAPDDAAAAARVRALQRQAQENERQIRELEKTLQRLQSGGVNAPSAPAVAPAAASGEISAWTSGTGSAAPAATEQRPSAPFRLVVPRPAAKPIAAKPGRRPKIVLASAPLKQGMTQEKVWEKLGAPEFVRGRREGVQFWHYGPGWIRFQQGRITRWEAGNARQASASR
jgi:hypothetical protein